MLLSASTSHGTRTRRRAAWIATAAVGVSLVLSGATTAPAALADTTATLSGVILGVGADEAQRIVTWYSSADTAQSVQVAPTSSLVNGRFPASATTFSASGTANIAGSGGYNRHATITGLAENTAYSYRVGSDGNWSPTAAFRRSRSTGTTTSCSSATRRSARRATSRRTKRAGRTR